MDLLQKPFPQYSQRKSKLSTLHKNRVPHMWKCNIHMVFSAIMKVLNLVLLSEAGFSEIFWNIRWSGQLDIISTFYSTTSHKMEWSVGHHIHILLNDFTQDGVVSWITCTHFLVNDFRRWSGQLDFVSTFFSMTSHKMKWSVGQHVHIF